MNKEDEWFVFLADFKDKKKAREIYKLGYRKGREAECLRTKKEIDALLLENEKHLAALWYWGAKRTLEKLKKRLEEKEPEKEEKEK